MAYLSLLLFSLSLFFFSFFSAFAAESSDVLLLLEKIKPALQGRSTQENLQLSSWNSSTPLCLWRGLQWTSSSSAAGASLPCNDSAVRSNLSLASDPSLQLLSIRLPAAALAGSIPPEIGDLSSLQSLYLGVNSLSGTLPLELGNCPALAEVDLADNSLSGSLPLSIWNLCDRLVSHRFHGNNFSNTVPYLAILNSSSDRLQPTFLLPNSATLSSLLAFFSLSLLAMHGELAALCHGGFRPSLLHLRHRLCGRRDRNPPDLLEGD